MEVVDPENYEFDEVDNEQQENWKGDAVPRYLSGTPKDKQKRKIKIQRKKGNTQLNNFENQW